MNYPKKHLIKYLPTIIGHVFFFLYYYTELFIPDFRDRRRKFGALILSFRLSMHRGHRLIMTDDIDYYIHKCKEYYGGEPEWFKNLQVDGNPNGELNQ